MRGSSPGTSTTNASSTSSSIRARWRGSPAGGRRRSSTSRASTRCSHRRARQPRVGAGGRETGGGPRGRERGAHSLPGRSAALRGSHDGGGGGPKGLEGGSGAGRRERGTGDGAAREGRGDGVAGARLRPARRLARPAAAVDERDRKSTRLNSSHVAISYAVFCLKKKNTATSNTRNNRINSSL